MTAPAPSSSIEGWSSTPTATGPAPGWRYAGFWARFLALLIDVILLGLFTTILAPIFGFGPSVAVGANRFDVNYATNAASTLVGLLYFVGFWALRGQTVGMIPFNMQVARATDGTRIDWVRGLLRYVGFIISVIPLFLGLIWAAFDSRKQGWHDKIADTVVVRPA